MSYALSPLLGNSILYVDSVLLPEKQAYPVTQG